MPYPADRRSRVRSVDHIVPVANYGDAVFDYPEPDASTSGKFCKPATEYNTVIFQIQMPAWVIEYSFELYGLSDGVAYPVPVPTGTGGTLTGNSSPIEVPVLLAGSGIALRLVDVTSAAGPDANSAPFVVSWDQAFRAG